ncbi:hypothetical protein FHX77_000310 [Bifidobacterium commune]|uniref:Uncharacterized protein n=1 Tax=Bifidobacterium commune TaxID=1505727 RepID=A0A1C4H360_9BIFI|nr:hypothetical protein [Bifidobacterium commune]SCC79070.1 hypothetical protein GA0061077_0560 [Bifidobacterium commune]
MLLCSCTFKYILIIFLGHKPLIPFAEVYAHSGFTLRCISDFWTFFCTYVRKSDVFVAECSEK